MILKKTKSIFNEIEFTVKDLDALTEITDVLLINVNVTDIESVLIKHVKEKHSITTLSGNTWEILNFEFTGRQVEIVKTYFEKSPANHKINYPIISEC